MKTGILSIRLKFLLQFRSLSDFSTDNEYDSEGELHTREGKYWDQSGPGNLLAHYSEFLSAP